MASRLARREVLTERLWPTVWVCLPGRGPTPQDAVTARRILLDGLTRDAVCL